MLSIRPIHLKAANEFVKQWHRHNIPTVGGKFAISVYDDDKLCGVAICGRPIARHFDDGSTLEINRCCTDGTHNACSKLYGTACRIGFEMGYKRIITYTIQNENGTSLKASGFTFEGEAGGITWSGNRKRNYYISPAEKKYRWVRYGNKSKRTNRRKR